MSPHNLSTLGPGTDLYQSRCRVNGKDLSILDRIERGMMGVRTGLPNMVYLLFIFNNFSRPAE